MDNETIRTLITGISAVLTTGTVAYFGYLTTTRKTKIEKLHRELTNVYKQFSNLYKVEDKLLTKLEENNLGNKQTLKIDIRKQILGDTNEKITFTDESVKNRLNQLEKY